MAMIFSRPGFGSGLTILKYNGDDGEPIRHVLRPKDKGKSIEFASEAKAAAKYGNGRWLLTPAEHNSRKNTRANNKAGNKSRKF